MKEEDLISTWKSSTDEEMVRLKKSRMITDMQSEADRWIKASKSRNLQLLLSILFAVPLFGIMTYTTPYIVSKIGAILCLVSFIHWYIRMRSAKKLKPRSFSETYLDYLIKMREHLKVGKKLAYGGLYWLLLPCTVGSILFRLGFFINTQESILKIIGIIGLSIVAYLIYRWTTKQFRSGLVKIDKLIKALEE